MFLKNINKLTKDNDNFREVIFTGTKSQLVLMNIPVNEDIGMEVHKDVDQILFIIEGTGTAILNKVNHDFSSNDVIYVTAGTMHNVINTGKNDLKLFTVYAPPNHPEETLHKTKEDALQEEFEKGGE